MKQMLVNAAQDTDAGALAKLVQPPHIRHDLAVGQMGELSPGLLFGEHLHQQIEGMHRSQHAQQMHAPQLRSAQLATPAPPAMRRQQIVDEIVGNMRRNQIEKFYRSSLRQLGIHGQRATQKNDLRPADVANAKFSR